MGKTSRLTKAKKNDFNKVKFKAGKKKPKANNVTSIGFKSQSLYITEQFQSNEIDSLHSTGNNVDIQFSKLRHTTPTIRYNALKHIHGFLSTITDIDFDFLTLFEKVSKLLDDDDSEVRKALYSLLKSMFVLVAPKLMKHHFSLLLTHLRCAMDHLSMDVKYDSLKVLDLILDHYSSLMNITESFQILNILLEMISTKTDNKKRPRILAMKFRTKETSTRWYNTVFSQIERILTASKPVVEEDHHLSVEAPLLHCTDEWINSISSPKQDLFEEKTLINFSWELTSKEPTAKDIQLLMTQFVPLLIQSWTEATNSDERCKDLETTRNMRLVVNIILNFVDYLIQNCCVSDALDFIFINFNDVFDEYFYSKFPFSKSEFLEIKEVSNLKENKKEKRKRKDKQNKEISKRKGAPSDVDFMHLNLAVCNLITLVSIKSKVNGHVELLEKVSSYILSVLTSKFNCKDDEILKKVLMVSSEIIKTGNTDFNKEIVVKIIEHYESSAGSEKSLIFLHFIYSNYAKDHFRNSDCLEGFHKLILDKLMFSLKLIQETNQTICKLDKKDHIYRHYQILLEILQYSHVRKELNYINQLSNQIIELIGFLSECNKTGIFCNFTKRCFTCTSSQQRILCSTLYHIDVISNQLTEALCSYCINTHSSIIRTVVDVFEDFLSNKTFEKNRSSFKEIKFFMIMILTAGTLSDHNNKIEATTSEDLKRISTNCSFVLDTWNMWFTRKLLAFPTPIKLYLKKFLSFPSAAYPESWIGYLATFIFVSKQPFFEEIIQIDSIPEDFGRFLAISFTTSSNDEDLKEIYKLSIEAFKICPQIRLPCLQDLLIEDEGVVVLVDLVQNDYLSDEMNLLTDYINKNLEKTLNVQDSGDVAKDERFENTLLIKTYLRKN